MNIIIIIIYNVHSVTQKWIGDAYEYGVDISICTIFNPLPPPQLPQMKHSVWAT